MAHGRAELAFAEERAAPRALDPRGRSMQLGGLSDERTQEFEVIVRAHHGAMVAFARRLSGDSAEAHDLVQDTLERALRRLDTLRPGSNARAWLFTILHHGFIDRCRKRTYEATTALGEEEVAMPPASEPGAPPAWTAISAEQLRAAIAALDESFRTVYRMHSLEGRSYQEIALALGIPVNTVGTRLARARRKLKALLEEAASLAESGTGQ